MTIRPPIRFVFLLCVACGLAGCSQRDGATSRSAALLQASAACDERMPHIEDLGGILATALIDRRPVAGDGQSCEFLTGGFPAITVSVRPNVGHATMDAWHAGKMPFTAVALSGTGDEAVWQDKLREVIAQKDNLLCDIQVRGGDSDIEAAVEVLPRVLGAVCNKVFTTFG